MLKKRREAAETIAHRLLATEAAIDEALACAAKLTGAMPNARLTAGVAAQVGQEAMEQAVRTVSALVTARQAIVDTHKRLAETQIQVGLREINFGGMMLKPLAQDTQPIAIEESPLVGIVA
jgi:hypothetical protein